MTYGRASHVCSPAARTRSPSNGLRIIPNRTCICRKKRVQGSGTSRGGKEAHHAQRLDIEQRDHLHDGGHAAEVRPRRLGRGWLGAEADGRRTGDARLRPRRREGVHVEVWDRSRVEPTDDSFQAAADFAVDGDFEGFVAVGGGSSIDTAKVSALIATHGGEIMDYVNAPVGGGKKPPGPLKPLLAIPTTAGTGAEATTVAILDIPDQRVKSGISHQYLRPDRGVVDPLLTLTMPPEVTSSCGLDVVCHAAESYISKPYDARPKPE